MRVNPVRALLVFNKYKLKEALMDVYELFGIFSIKF